MPPANTLRSPNGVDLFPTSGQGDKHVLKLNYTEKYQAEYILPNFNIKKFRAPKRAVWTDTGIRDYLGYPILTEENGTRFVWLNPRMLEPFSGIK